MKALYTATSSAAGGLLTPATANCEVTSSTLVTNATRPRKLHPRKLIGISRLPVTMIAPPAACQLQRNPGWLSLFGLQRKLIALVYKLENRIGISLQRDVLGYFLRASMDDDLVTTGRKRL